MHLVEISDYALNQLTIPNKHSWSQPGHHIVDTWKDQVLEYDYYAHELEKLSARCKQVPVFGFPGLAIAEIMIYKYCSV